MPRLTRYIARLYLINIATLLVLLFSFVITVDMVMNLRRFTRVAERILEERGAESMGFLAKSVTTLSLVADLWGPRLLQLFVYLGGTVLIAAMGFTCSQLVRNREFVAVMASGISLHRIVRPFLIVALAVAALQLIDQEILIPRVAHLLERDIGDSGEREIDAFRVTLASDGAGHLLHADRYSPSEQVLTRPRVFERDAAGGVLRVIRGESARWDGRGWALEGGIVEDLAADTGTASVERLPIALDPEGLLVHHLQGLGQNLSWPQISRMLASEGLDSRVRQRLQRARWGRLGALACSVLALVAALPLFLVRMPQPMILPALRCAPIALIGLGASAASTSISLAGIPEWLGALLPMLIVAPIAVVMHTSIRS